MTDDMTFCKNGWDECKVTRCERHPSNIKHKELPHSYAELYRTEYCFLEWQKKPVEVLPPVQVLSEEDLIELEDRFGAFVRFVVEDMISGKGERWSKDGE